MDELFEALTLIQTGKIRNFPVGPDFGTAYWRPLVDLLRRMAIDRTIAAQRISNLLLMTDDLDEAIGRLDDATPASSSVVRSRVQSRRPAWWLGESDA